MSAQRDDDPSWAEAPLILDEPHTAIWDEICDVAVVGVGMAGACAALEAAEGGADVIALDRFDGGGASAISGGVYYGGGTAIQKEAGVEDDADQLNAYLTAELGNAVSSETIRRFSDENAKSFEWLRKHGVRFNSNLYTPKTAYPPEPYYLYYSGNERLAEYAAKAKPAARGHRAYMDNPAGRPSGEALMRPLLDSLPHNRVRLIPHSPVVRLVQDRSGRVIGVEALALPEPAYGEHMEHYRQVLPIRSSISKTGAAAAIRAARRLETSQGQRRLIRARRGVVLSAGGFINNPAWMRAQGGTVDYSRVVFMGRLGCDGSGIALGRSVGGAVGLMGNMFSACKLAPPNAYAHGALVNPAGERFRTEEAYASTLGNDITRKFGGRAWIVLDLELFLQAIWQLRPRGDGLFTNYYAPAVLNIILGGTRVSWSLEGLARKCGMDAATLKATIDTVNDTVATRAPDPFYKPPGLQAALTTRPFFSINVSVDNPWAFTSVFTLGGLKVDEKTSQVLREDGSGIAGLYAAGRNAVGLPSESYVSGMSISDCVFSGRRAGRSLSRQSDID